jgi:hypothetical protein
MQLFVRCAHHRNHDIIVNSPARVRAQLPYTFTLICPLDRRPDYYTNRQVQARTAPAGTVGGALLGGIIGILGGPVGVIIGGLAGGALGRGADQADANAVRTFNAS